MFTDQPTDRRTDKASYRVACPQLKTRLSVPRNATDVNNDDLEENDNDDDDDNNNNNNDNDDKNDLRLMSC